MNILLVEDEQSVSNFILKGFESEGYQIDVAFDGTTGKSLFAKKNYDLAILDVNLPGINGFQLCTDFKSERPNLPIIFLTALDGLDDKITGFESGADDYLVKPFEFQELLMRTKALLRRSGSKFITEKKIVVADLEMETSGKIVTRAGKRIDLTAREFSLLEYLMINKGRVVSRVDIAERVWDLNFDTSTNVIDVYINYLRKKIDKGYEPKLLHTIVGMGYTLRED
ncbi:MAG TPA: DNA-binding response regulator [Cytophagales bacterium]|jgi:two-component system, OmpR family, copper resistance phosphate regulon response regulator CusR|nr:DNA-binding response regulator [Cytophagales bacterium]